MAIVSEKIGHAELVGGEVTSLHSHAGSGGSEYPIGWLLMSAVNTNPATWLGYGTWAYFSTGRVMVGVDVGDEDFDTVEKTGGSKTADYNHSSTIIKVGSGDVAGTLDHDGMSIVQPYIAVYYWKRTS